jgi:5'-nucleotidase
VTSKGADEQEPEDTDVYALAVDRVVSVTPISLDLTAKSAFSRSGAWSACFKQS